jgi:hypothetical protein
MVKKLKAKDITVSEMPDRRNLKILFTDNAIVDMLEFVEKTEVGNRPGSETKKSTCGTLRGSTRETEREKGQWRMARSEDVMQHNSDRKVGWY